MLAALERSYGTTQQAGPRRTEGEPVTIRALAVGVHVLDIHVRHVESIPSGSDGALVDQIRMSPAGTAGGTAVVLAKLGAAGHQHGRGRRPTRSAGSLRELLAEQGVDVSGLVAQGRGADLGQRAAGAAQRRPAGVALHRRQRRVHPRRRRPRRGGGGRRACMLGGPEFLGGDAAATLLEHARAHGTVTAVDMLAPGDPDMLEWVGAALPHADYFLPNDEQLLGLTGAVDAGGRPRRRCSTAGVGCVAATCGARGALVATADGHATGCRPSRSTWSTRPAAATRSAPAS